MQNGFRTKIRYIWFFALERGSMLNKKRLQWSDILIKGWNTLEILFIFGLGSLSLPGLEWFFMDHRMQMMDIVGTYLSRLLYPYWFRSRFGIFFYVLLLDRLLNNCSRLLLILLQRIGNDKCSGTCTWILDGCSYYTFLCCDRLRGRDQVPVILIFVLNFQISFMIRQE